MQRPARLAVSFPARPSSGRGKTDAAKSERGVAALHERETEDRPARRSASSPSSPALLDLVPLDARGARACGKGGPAAFPWRGGDVLGTSPHGAKRSFRRGPDMNQKQVGALLVLKELDITHRMESFEDRLSVQKSIYLAQAAGVGLGHFFNWYLRGPYSPTLTQDVFDAIQNFDPSTALQGWELDKATRARLTALRGSFAPPAGLAKPSWLELMASVHYLIDRNQAEGGDADTLRCQLAKYNKVFSTPQVLEAMTRLRTNGLIS